MGGIDAIAKTDAAKPEQPHKTLETELFEARERGLSLKQATTLPAGAPVT